MDLETACRDLKEPGIIDEKILYNTIIEQGPKGEEGRLFKEQGIVYGEITYLRLEFLNILKIDHLWMMTGLTKLQLCNNAIEKIENLNALVLLKELDLSFNNIVKIENLNALLNLEVLTLYQNKIEVLENLEHLLHLTVFSIGNNKLNSLDCIMYLRKFENLKSFTMAGNPICEEDKFDKFAIAYLPQLVYYEYRMVMPIEREEAREHFLNNLIKLEREEAEMKEIEIAKNKAEQEERLNAEAFVDYLGGNHLFLSLFEKDLDCKILLQIGDYVTDVYNEKVTARFQKNFMGITKELHAFGLQQLEIRKVEMQQFEKFVGAAKEKAFVESRAIVEDFLEQKTTLFEQVREAINTEVEDEDTANEISLNLQIISEAFRDLCQRTWSVLMQKELQLFEATEEVNGTYERSLTELVNHFVEGAQAQFTQLRQLQNTFNEALIDSANKFFTNYTVATATGHAHEYKNMSKELINLMQDKEVLANALSTSHDYHLLVIDQREDKLISSIKTWLALTVDNLVQSEINRNRTSVMEVNNFLDIQKAELQETLSAPVGLLLLSKEIHDALQI